MHPYRPLVVPVETLDERRIRLRERWMRCCMMQTSPRAAEDERRAWKAYAAVLAER